MDCNEASNLMRRPTTLAVALFCRFAVMPAVSAFTVSYDKLFVSLLRCDALLLSVLVGADVTNTRVSCETNLRH